MLALCLSAVLSSQALAPKPIPPIDWNDLPYQDTVRRMAQGWRAKYGLPGVWCAFIKDGKVVACVADGYRNLETHRLATVDDYVPLASVSKPVTGSLIAQFVAKGYITYETSVGDVFPNIAKKFPTNPFFRSTLRQLLAHTSALTLAIGFEKADRSSGPRFRLSHVEIAASSSELREPGTKYEYNNAGPVIATAMVEKVTGMTLEEWIRGEFAQRIGLTIVKSYEELPDLGRYYLQDGRTTYVPFINRRPVMNPAGGYALTLGEMCAFAQSTILDAAELPKKIVRETQTRTSDQLKSDTSASWHISTTGYLFHDGGLPGLFCSLRINLKSRSAFIWASNGNVAPGSKFSSIGQYEDIKKDILQLLFG